MKANITKASPQDLRDARSFDDLKVNEVSVVDRPAIRRQFVLLKRQMEEQGMGVKGTQITTEEAARFNNEVVKGLEALGFKFAQIDVEKKMPVDLANSLKVVVPWMRKMAGQTDGDVRSAIMRAASLLSNVGDGKLPVPKPEDDMTGKRKAAEEETEAERKAREAKEEKERELQAKRKAEEEEEEEDGVKGKGKKGKKVGPPFEDEEEEKRKAKKQKAISLDDDSSATIIKVDEDGGVHIVTKGRKAMTAERSEKLAGAATNLLSLLKETDEAAYKVALEQIAAEKELPSNAKVDSKVRPVGEGGVPSMVAKGEEVPAWAQDIAKRLDSIEKARSPSTSVADEGDTTNQEKVAKKGGLNWGSILR